MYTPKLKDAALELLSHYSVKDVSEMLNIKEGTLYLWKKNLEEKQQRPQRVSRHYLDLYLKEMKSLKSDLNKTNEKYEILSDFTKQFHLIDFISTKGRNEFITKNSNRFSITTMCELLGVSKQWYYKCLKNKEIK